MDWSGLPGDLLRLFSGRLHDPLDFLRFSAVCRAWRTATAAAAASPPPFLPWLLTRPAPISPTAGPSLSFYSLSSAALRSVAAPSATCSLLGHTNSHLLFSDHGPLLLLLLNPLTGADLPLPPSPFNAFSPITQGYYLPGPDSPVVLYDTRRIFFHHPGGGGWTTVPVVDLVAENMYHAGKVFVCNDRGHLTIFDAATLAVLGEQEHRTSRRIAGGLLCIGGSPARDCGGEIAGFSLRAADFAGLEGNCVYFFKMDRASRGTMSWSAWRLKGTHM
uniref:KIB1-4 beta-propeller domain-containing protein n=1 Tax=Oryza barthii TaxID=65489 RepID=A0A0D3HBD0_9ORYZ